MQPFPHSIPEAATSAFGSIWVVLTRDRALVDFLRSTPKPNGTFLHTLVKSSPFTAEVGSIELPADSTRIGSPFHHRTVHALRPNVRGVAAAIFLGRRGESSMRKLSFTIFKKGPASLEGTAEVGSAGGCLA